MNPLRVRSESPEMTCAVASALAKFVGPGDLLALCGELGSGKTCFTQGLASALGVKECGVVTSPTFVLLNVYHGRVPIYHFDAYRIQGPAAWLELGADDLVYASGLCVLEWADRVDAALPEDRLEILFSHGGGSVRVIEFRARGRRSREILDAAAPVILSASSQ